MDDCYVSPDSQTILSLNTIYGRPKGFRVADFTTSQNKLSVLIAKANLAVDPNNKYYKEQLDRLQLLVTEK